MKKAVPIIIVAVIVIAGAIYYFASKNNNSAQMANMPNQSQSATSNAQATDKVTIQGMAFNPANITVKKGTTVTWTNEDSIGHTVTETDGQSGPDSGTLGKGQSYTFTYNTAGTFKYHCTIHTNMTGTVTVTE